MLSNLGATNPCAKISDCFVECANRIKEDHAENQEIPCILHLYFNNRKKIRSSVIQTLSMVKKKNIYNYTTFRENLHRSSQGSLLTLVVVSFYETQKGEVFPKRKKKKSEIVET